MSARTFAIVLFAVLLVVAGAFAMRSHGHAMMARWLPAIHGGRATH